MVQLIQEYCLVLTGVRVLCTNQPTNGTRQTVLSTNGNSVMENIISIFGAKQSRDLIKIKCPTEDGTEEGVYTQQSLADLDNSTSILDIRQPDLDILNLSKFKIDGYISNIEHHCARSSKDRQYFYINSRPVELKVISKLVNDVYHRYNLKQFPFVYLNLKMDQSSVDVNRSKDKRQVAVCNDKILQLAVKRSLLNTYGELPSKFRIASINSSVKGFRHDVQDESEDEDGDKILVLEPGDKFGASLKQWRMNPNDPTPLHKRKSSSEPNGQKEPKIKHFFHQKIQAIEDRNTSFERPTDKENSFTSSPLKDFSFKIDCKTPKSQGTLKFEVVKKDVVKAESTTNIGEESRTKEHVETLEKTFLQISEPLSDDCFELETIADNVKSSIDSNEKSQMVLSLDGSSVKELNHSSDNEVIEVDYFKPNTSKFSSTIKVSIGSIRTVAKAEEEAYDQMTKDKKSRRLKLRFKESIDPSKNKKAEVELETEIQKDMFKEMEVLGQFNLGFIIAKLNSDLFIVDQHASDEKYNFEDLQKTTKLQTQPLVIPERFELTAIQEMTLIENQKVFEMNGFKFLIDDSAEAGKKVKIHSKPFSKNWEFGKEDVEEMIFMLDNAPNAICRPSRIQTMLASRACRKSIMIGDALTKKQMKQLLVHMGELEHPWVRIVQDIVPETSNHSFTFTSRIALMVAPP